MAINLLKRSEKGAPLSADNYDDNLIIIETETQAINEKGSANGYASLGAGGLVPVAQLGSGTPDGTKFLRDDGTFAVPPGGGGGASKDSIIVAAPGDVDVAGYDILQVKVDAGASSPVVLLNGTPGQLVTIWNIGFSSKTVTNTSGYYLGGRASMTFASDDACLFQFNGGAWIQISQKINMATGAP